MKTLPFALMLSIPALSWGGEVGAPRSPWTLDRALAHVAEGSPDAASAEARLRKAEAELREARAALWPRVSAETGYSATDNPPAAFMMLLNQRQLTFDRDFNAPGLTDNWGSELRADYPIYAGGARKAAIAAAEHGVAASRWALEAARDGLRLEVAKAYYEIFRAREVAAAAAASVRSRRSHLELARELVEEKAALQTAVLDLATQLAEAEAQLVFAENARDVQVAYLRTLLGLELGVGFEVADRLEGIEEPGPAAGERPDLRALRARGRQAEAGVDLAEAALRPSVNAFASTRHDEGFQESDSGDSWIAGVAVRIDLFDGGARRARVEQAAAGAAELREQERKQRLAVALQTETARLALKAARKRIDLGEAAVTSAAESRELTRKRFEEGLALSTELIDAETALTGARVHLAGARAEERIALASLRHALGLPIR